MCWCNKFIVIVIACLNIRDFHLLLLHMNKNVAFLHVIDGSLVWQNRQNTLSLVFYFLFNLEEYSVYDIIHMKTSF